MLMLLKVCERSRNHAVGRFPLFVDGKEVWLYFALFPCDLANTYFAQDTIRLPLKSPQADSVCILSSSSTTMQCRLREGCLGLPKPDFSWIMQ